MIRKAEQKNKEPMQASAPRKNYRFFSQTPAFFRRPFSSLNIFGMKGLCPLRILPADPVLTEDPVIAFIAAFALAALIRILISKMLL